MVKMTPEQEAAYALDFGVARSDLPEDAQLAYDRMVEQRAHAGPFAPVPEADGGDVSSSVTVQERIAAAVGTALFLPVAAGFGIVLVPYVITHWQPGAPRGYLRSLVRGADVGEAIRRTVRGLPKAGAWLVATIVTPNVGMRRQRTL